MKITIIGPSYPYRGGISLFSNRLADELVSEGHDVNIVTFKLQYPSILFPGKTQFSQDINKSKVITERMINSVNPFNWYLVGNQIKKATPDLVIFKYWMPFMAPCFGVIAKEIKKNNSSKIIALIHNLIPHEKRFGDTFLTKYFLRQIDGFVAMSKSVLSDINRFDELKPKVLSPHPLYDNFGSAILREEALDRLNLNSKYRYMLFFGIIRKYKGLDILLEAFADKRLNKDTLKLVVAGEFYEDETEYQDIIKKYQLESSVIMIKEFIPDSEVVNYFCAADIIVQPYRNATQSGVTQIAYHFDKPMLVTDVGGLKEIVPNNIVGYVTEPDVESVADALVDFYQNNRAEHFIEGVKEEKKKYSWKTMTETIFNLLVKL